MQDPNKGNTLEHNSQSYAKVCSSTSNSRAIIIHPTNNLQEILNKPSEELFPIREEIYDPILVIRQEREKLLQQNEEFLKQIEILKRENEDRKAQMIASRQPEQTPTVRYCANDQKGKCTRIDCSFFHENFLCANCSISKGCRGKPKCKDAKTPDTSKPDANIDTPRKKVSTCRHDPNCTRPPGMCMFDHPSRCVLCKNSQSCDVHKPSNTRKPVQPCKFGSNCRRPKGECWFDHPLRSDEYNNGRVSESSPQKSNTQPPQIAMCLPSSFYTVISTVISSELIDKQSIVDTVPIAPGLSTFCTYSPKLDTSHETPIMSKEHSSVNTLTIAPGLPVVEQLQVDEQLSAIEQSSAVEQSSVIEQSLAGEQSLAVEKSLADEQSSVLVQSSSDTLLVNKKCTYASLVVKHTTEICKPCEPHKKSLPIAPRLNNTNLLSLEEYQRLTYAFGCAISRPGVLTNMELYIKNTKHKNNTENKFNFNDELELLKQRTPKSIEFLIYIWFRVYCFAKEDWQYLFKNGLEEYIMKSDLDVIKVRHFFLKFESCWNGDKCKYKNGCIRTHGPAQCWDQFSGCGLCTCSSTSTEKKLSDDGFNIVEKKKKQQNTCAKNTYKHDFGPSYFAGLKQEEYICTEFVDLPEFISNENLPEIHMQQLARVQAINAKYQQQLLDKRNKYESDIRKFEALVNNPVIRSITPQEYGELVQGIHDWQKNDELVNLLPCFQISYKKVSDRLEIEMKKAALSIATNHGFTEDNWHRFLDTKVYDYSSITSCVTHIPYIMKESTFLRFMAHIYKSRGLLTFYEYGLDDTSCLPECRINNLLDWSLCSARYNKFFNVDTEDDNSNLDERVYDMYHDDQAYFFGISKNQDIRVLGNMIVAPLANTPIFTKYKSQSTSHSFYEWLLIHHFEAYQLWYGNLVEKKIVSFDTCIHYTTKLYDVVGISLEAFIEDPEVAKSFLSISKFKLQSDKKLITWTQFRELNSEDQNNLVQYFYQGLSLIKNCDSFGDAIKCAKECKIVDGEYTKNTGNAPLCSILLCSLAMLPNNILNKFIKYTNNLTITSVVKLDSLRILVDPISAPYFSILATALLTPEFFVDEEVRQSVLIPIRDFWNENKHESHLKFDDTPLIRDINNQIKKCGTVSLFSNMLVPEITKEFLQALKKRHKNFIGCPLQFIFGTEKFTIDENTILYINLFSEIINKTLYVKTHMNELKKVIGISPLISDICTRFFTKSVRVSNNRKRKIVTKRNKFYAGVADDSDSDESDSESDSHESDSHESDSDNKLEIAEPVNSSTYSQPLNSKFFGVDDDDDDDEDDINVKIVSSEKKEKEHLGVVNLCRIVNRKFIDGKGETTSRTGTLLVFKESISEARFKKINDELPSSCPRFGALHTDDETTDQVFFMPYKGTDTSVNTQIHYAIAKVLNRDINSICVQGLEEETKVMVKKVEKPIVNIKPMSEKKLTGKAAWAAAQLAKAAAKEQAKSSANVNIKPEKAPKEAPRRAPLPSKINKKTIKVSEDDEVVDLSDLDMLEKLGY